MASTNGTTPNNDTPSDLEKELKKDGLVLTVPMSGAAYAPFRKAWETYANQPMNSGKSNSQLLREMIAEHISFDLSTITIKNRGKSDTDGKVLNLLIKKAKETHDKKSAIDAMAMHLIASGVDVSDMFTPEEIKRFKQLLKEESPTTK